MSQCTLMLSSRSKPFRTFSTLRTLRTFAAAEIIRMFHLTQQQQNLKEKLMKKSWMKLAILGVLASSAIAGGVFHAEASDIRILPVDTAKF